MTTTVVHVLEALEGGTARHLVDICRHVGDVDHVVVTPTRRSHGVTDEEATARMTGAGATVRHLPMRRTAWSPVNLWAAMKLRSLLRATSPDIVHTHSSIGGVVGRLAALGTGVATVHTPNALTDVTVGRFIERVLARRATDIIVAVSASEAHELSRHGVQGRLGVIVVPNGVSPSFDPTPGAIRGRLGLDPGTPLVGTVARLVPQKAPEVFVAAMDRVLTQLPASHAVLIGDGVQRARFDQAVAAMAHPDRFHHLDRLPDAGSALGDLDVFVLTSRFEGLPYAPLEAMRAGTPVVLTDVVGNRDVVEHGVSGLLVPEGDPTAVAAAVVSILAEPSLAARLGEAGSRRVQTEFDLTTTAQELGHAYQRLADR